MAAPPVYLKDKSEIEALALVDEVFYRASLSSTGGLGGSTVKELTVTIQDMKNPVGPMPGVKKLRLILSDTTKLGSLDLAANAVITSASTGAILHGAGTPEALIETDSNGVWVGVLTNAVDETVFFSVCSPEGGGIEYGQVLARNDEANGIWSA